MVRYLKSREGKYAVLVAVMVLAWVLCIYGFGLNSPDFFRRVNGTL